ncbi:hypothetical protein BUALT_Bualt11G0112800 [Buddleja alternifolia]|uniref:Uncharacterized protein n=1 Tax=Buddleja alternifolia TaxID=168488 RepID=A0AAV6X1D7_9LAMI|nr:hypothetical protein BUALT_Bualt11G0112800 [Buddleja alternifolia]
MQTPKSRPGSLDVPQKPSPATPRTGRKLWTPGSDSNSASSPNLANKTPKTRSPKVVDRRSPRSTATEKKKPGRVSELEPQLAQLQEELKKAKDQLSSSESLKKRAQHEAEETKEQLSAMLAKLEETQNQLKELSDSEESRVQELLKISHDRDREWQSELEAVHKQHSMDTSALASALNEIQRLKIQLDRVSESETSQARHAESAYAEIKSLRVELTETLDLVEKLKNQLNDSRESEARALEEVARFQMLLEIVKSTEETLQLENANAREKYKFLLVELEESKNRVNSLEGVVGNLQTDLAKSRNDEKLSENGECDETELNKLKNEVSQLKEALEAAERRYGDQYVESTLQIRNAFELVEQAKSKSSQKEAELEAKLKESKAEVEELKSKLAEKQNPEVEIEVEKSESVLEHLKASLWEKENKLQSITEENEILKSEIKKRETEKIKENDEAIALTEAARAAEREALMKLGHLTEEADKSCRKAARVSEELDAVQAANSEIEAELRRLKVQSDQWRKAAEAAAAMISNGNNGKYVERAGSLGYHTIGGKLDLPYSDDIDDDSPKKKNGNMLKKIGVLLKKGPK